MENKIKELLDESNNFYNLVVGTMIEVTEPMKERELSNEQLVDIGFFCREMETLFNELRKEVKARKDLCGQIVAYSKTKESISDPSIKMTVEGQYAIGTPDVKMQAALPKKDSKEYLRFCKFLGDPEDVAEQGVLKLDWNSVTEFCTQLIAEGKPVPEGLGRKYPLYVTRYRRKTDG